MITPDPPFDPAGPVAFVVLVRGVPVLFTADRYRQLVEAGESCRLHNASCKPPADAVTAADYRAAAAKRPKKPPKKAAPELWGSDGNDQG